VLVLDQRTLSVDLTLIGQGSKDLVAFHVGAHLMAELVKDEAH
jgi:hypothetical protein